MPNAKVWSKEADRCGAVRKAAEFCTGVIVDYKGITVAQDTELRAVPCCERRVRCRQEHADPFRLPTMPATPSWTTSQRHHFHGSTTDDYPLHRLASCATSPRRTRRFEIKGGFMEKVRSPSVDALASLPAPVQESLVAQVLGTVPCSLFPASLRPEWQILEKNGATAESCGMHKPFSLPRHRLHTN